MTGIGLLVNGLVLLVGTLHILIIKCYPIFKGKSKIWIREYLYNNNVAEPIDQIAMLLGVIAIALGCTKIIWEFLSWVFKTA